MSDTNKQAKAQQLQHEIDNNLPFDVKVGKKNIQGKVLDKLLFVTFQL